MNTKEYLRQAYRLNELIDSNIREIESLKILAFSLPGSSFDEKIKGGKMKDESAFASCVQKIIDLEEEINKEIDEYVDLKTEIRNKINRVQDKNQRVVLRLRYLEFFTWERIAETLGYSVREIHRIHAKALKHVTV